MNAKDSEKTNENRFVLNEVHFKIAQVSANGLFVAL